MKSDNFEEEEEKIHPSPPSRPMGPMVDNVLQQHESSLHILPTFLKETFFSYRVGVKVRERKSTLTMEQWDETVKLSPKSKNMDKRYQALYLMWNLNTC